MYIASPLCIGCLQESMPLLSIWLSLVHSVISASEELSSSHGDPPSMVRTVWHIALKITVSGVSKNISQWRNISTPCLMVSMMTFEYWEAVSSSSDQRNVVLGLGILKVLTCPLVAHSWPLVRRCQTTLSYVGWMRKILCGLEIFGQGVYITASECVSTEVDLLNNKLQINGFSITALLPGTSEYSITHHQCFSLSLTPSYSSASSVIFFKRGMSATVRS